MPPKFGLKFLIRSIKVVQGFPIWRLRAVRVTMLPCHGDNYSASHGVGSSSIDVDMTTIDKLQAFVF